MWRDGRCLRVHQEDFCQALAVHPRRKYQNDGGPSAKDIAGILSDQSSDATADIRSFADALIFNWLIAGTDAHAKNFSILIAPGGQVRLAPLYDLASSLPYPRQIDPMKARLAMKIGGSYRLRDITRRHWESCARDLRMPADALLARIMAMIDSLQAAIEQMPVDPDDLDLPRTDEASLGTRLLQRAGQLRDVLG